jgi:SAM-dependent methyltransferase
MSSHEKQLQKTFDRRAKGFERAPVQSDPRLLDALVKAAGLPARSHVLDTGCGPGLVGEALLQAGHRVLGVDLSEEMICLARLRCAAYGDRARFEQRSLFDPSLAGPFDAAISRFVMHHTPDPAAFLHRQFELLLPGGVLVMCEQTTDPNPAAARWHQDLEKARDHPHTRNPSSGELVDLFASVGLTELRLEETPFVLDFDEWFDRGVPTEPKEVIRQRLLAGPACRGFRATAQAGTAVRIDGWLAMVRGVKPAG